MSLIDTLRAYTPWNEQEARDRDVMVRFLTDNPDAFVRSNLTAHVTASGWVISRDGSKVLMAYHKIYNSWAWTGGHADGETDLLSVAVREAKEESGLQTVTPVTDTPFSVEILTVDGHEKRGQYVPSHLHLNVTYLLRGDEGEPLRVKEDENAGVRWFSPQEALEKCTEPWMIDRVYTKLIEKWEKMRQGM
ncbi:MAG: NUDIX domain-containing protein [Clostridiales bacterium]|nr:NUDIX domain-containing protein [Clostridiales bacterium]